MRTLILGLGMFLVAGCEYFLPAGPPSDPLSPTPLVTAMPLASASASVPANSSCSDASIEGVKQALRDVASYAYEGEGYVESLEDFPGGNDVRGRPERTIRRVTKFTGAYVAPDRQTEERLLVTRDDVMEARRTIGDDVWVRFVGSRRWQPLEVTPAPANPILAIVDQPPTWAFDDSVDMPGHCRFVGTSADGGLALTVLVTVPVGSDMPTSVGVTERLFNPFDWGQAIGRADVYNIETDARVTIDPPPIDASPATADDFLYALEGRSCAEPPCDVSDVSLAYEVHDSPVDLFGYEGPDGSGYVWFENGRLATMGRTSCDAPEWDVTVHTNGEPGDPQWIGGQLDVAEPATMHVRWRDGEVTEHTVSAPGYIVPAGVVGGAAIESISVVAANGDELFDYVMPAPETGVPPPPDC